MIRAILFLQISQVLGRGFYLLFSLWYINNVFGVDVKGEWANMMTLYTMLSAFSNLGFEVWLTREVAGASISRQQAQAFLFKAKGGLWLICLGIGAWWVGRVGTSPMLALPFALIFVLDGVAVAEQAVFEGKSQARHIATMSFIKSGGFVILALPVALFFKPTDLVPFAWAFLAAIAIRLVFGWRCWRSLPSQATPVPKRAWKEFAVMGSFTVVTIIYFKIDLLMLTSMKGKLAAGYYDNAYAFVEGALFLSAAAGTMLYPSLVRSSGEERARQFDSMFLVVLLMGIVGTIGIWLFGPWVGSWIVGAERFSGSLQPLVILASALPVMFVNGLLNRWLFSFRRERFALLTASAVAVFNLVGNFLDAYDIRIEFRQLACEPCSV